MVPSIDQLWVILGGSILFILTRGCSALRLPTYDDSFRPTLGTVLRGMLLDVLIPAFGEEAFFRGIPWVILGLGLAEGEIVISLICIILFLAFNFVWAINHESDLFVIFLTGIFLGTVLFLIDSIYIVIAAHLCNNAKWFVRICWQNSRRNRKG